MIKNKTRRLYIRLTEDQFNEIRRRSEPFQTMSAFINAAITEFSDTSAREKLESRKRLADLFSRFDEKLAHLGGNLNQAMRRINENVKVDTSFHSLLMNDYMLRMGECHSLLIMLRKELYDITKKTVGGR